MRGGLEAAVLADDLTGAADTGIQFAAIAPPVHLVPLEALSLHGPWMSTAASISIDTGTRHSDANVAAQRVRRVALTLSRLRPRWVYKKIDSGLRGNLGAEIDALLDAAGFEASLVAPAFPAQGRTTIGGIHHIHGTPVAKTEFATDPLAPVTSSAVAAILTAQNHHSVGHIAVPRYADPERLHAAVRRECQRGRRLIVCDATEQAHLDRIAALVVQRAGRLLPVGSAGLAAGLVRRLSPAEGIETLACPPLARLLMICGTASPVTRRQVDALFERYPGVRCRLAPEWLVQTPAGERRARAHALLEVWSEAVLALQIATLPPGEPPTYARQALLGLAELAADIVRTGAVDGIFLSGGETAAAFRRACGAQAIALEREVLPGLVLGRWLGGAADAMPVITKAGAFGRDDTLMGLYARLSGGIPA